MAKRSRASFMRCWFGTMKGRRSTMARAMNSVTVMVMPCASGSFSPTAARRVRITPSAPSITVSCAGSGPATSVTGVFTMPGTKRVFTVGARFSGGAFGSGFCPGRMSRLRRGSSNTQRRTTPSGVCRSMIATLTRPPFSFRSSCTATTRTPTPADAGPIERNEPSAGGVHASPASSTISPATSNTSRLG